MKKIISGLVFVLLVGLFVSCATTSSGSSSLYRPLEPSEIAAFEIIGTVQVIVEKAFTSKWDGSVTQSNKEDAYIRLLAEAKKQYGRNDLDVKNISVVSRNPIMSIADLSATGDVVVRAGNNTTKNATGVEGALARAAGDTLKNVPVKSKIAIVYITAQDKSTTEYIAGELEFIWVNAGYVIIDRSQLDRIRREQNFQMSGEVDDNTAVSIGKIIGANIIVTGRVDGEGNLRRLRLRALDTQTAQVVGVASERL